MYIGVDGCSDGWIGVWYDETGYVGSGLFKSIQELWTAHVDDAETLLIDVPIGLREDSASKRPCDNAARKKLGFPRQSSVFPVPIRPAVHEQNYEDAKSTQERLTNGSLGTQSWGITNKIRELDIFLRESEPASSGVVREAHPEVCFWALNDEKPTQYSKRSQPAAAFWERVEILETVDKDTIAHVRNSGIGLDAKVKNDDILDALVLALTASNLTGELLTLPEEWPSNDEGDPTGLPMEMVYAYRAG